MIVVDACVDEANKQGIEMASAGSINLDREIFIGVCYHKPAPLIKTNFLVPIHVGKAQSSLTIPDAIGDNTGRNISHKNHSWCELTAAYWMRHNVKAEYYGLMHYRRLLNFSPKGREGVSHFEFATPYEFQRNGWRDELIAEACKDVDIITSPSWGVHPVGAPHIPMTNYEMYSREHFGRDMEIVDEIIRSKYPEIYPFFLSVMISRQCFFGNITIMGKSYFEEYSDWVFSVLEEAERKIDVSGYDSYQKRIWGFIAERLVNAYVMYAKSKRRAAVTSLPLVMGVHRRAPVETRSLLRYALKQRRQIEADRETDLGDSTRNIVNVVMALDDKYVPHAAVSIKSSLESSREPKNICFYILESNKIGEYNKQELTALAQQYGANLLFVSVADIDFSWLPLNRDYISQATYYRLVMDRVLPASVKKVVYIDADVIVMQPIEELWRVELGVNLIAGCPDEGGALQSRRLQLPIWHKYFNAGVLVFDVEKLRKIDLVGRVYSAFKAHGNYITLQDQDILNIIFAGETLSLPLRWNVGNRIYSANELEPSYSQDEALAAADQPAIVHFTDRIKPWSLRSTNPFTPLYWIYRNETAWKETVRENLTRRFSKFVRRLAGSRERRSRQALNIALKEAGKM